ncbi:G-D-S-L family lipolytic protein [Tritrichomonas foetus]|uniref:G-D-S-L family lipolytic protein n=1 Tax=Tritrichomonas foetus TaxID=1144522 RepID=A0A1J4KEE0_9EUKA|nr:G-D-S-L family lipolytic protein [Tritrichomonas foetus]|eukprot:OHT09799.1 G-D-S-L family lipolytic protein [Tritrichomonas foetus]
MFLFFAGLLYAAQAMKLYNVSDSDIPVIQNRGFQEELKNDCRRWPESAKVSNQAYLAGMKCAATVKIIFYTNSSRICFKYSKTRPYIYQHLSHWSMAGFALYGVDEDGGHHLCMPNFETNSGNANLNYYGLPEKITEYHVLLSTFDQVTELEIGVNDGSHFEYARRMNERPVIMYGTSIMHGACPCHAGNTWANMLHRKLDFPVYNMGVTGNGKLETDIISFIIKHQARAFVVDCLPNILGWSDVQSRVYNAVKQIRAAHPETPIVLVEFGMYGNEVFNDRNKNTHINTNKAQKAAYDLLLEEGVKNMYYVTTEELNYTSDDIVDTLHPLDTGMKKHANAVYKPLATILDLPNDELTYKTQKAITQYRYLGFRQRHYDLIEKIGQSKPTNVLFGDDIVAHWEGRSSFPSGYTNFGMNQDRIENVIWRVLHEEMFNYTATKIVLIAGGNNLETTTDDNEIVEGLKYLVERVKNKQPNAQIILSGLIPRKGLESRITTLNGKIQSMVIAQGKATYKDLGKSLLSGGSIDSSSYESDGIRLNDVGYTKLAAALN